MSQKDQPQTVRTRRGPFAYKVGDRVLVHESGDWRIVNGDLVRTPHDCSSPEQHWVSRLLSESDGSGFRLIAMPARLRMSRADRAERTYWQTDITLLDGEDWADMSTFKPGMTVMFTLDDDLCSAVSSPKGTVIEARVDSAHIEPGDWYASFTSPTCAWRIKRVVNERNMRIKEGGTP
ncbi:MAG: hypothetical protein Q7R80_01220 [bacterium]|nr:hypothetical protein [bacterium]